MKKGLLFLILLLIFPNFINAATLTEEQKALKEVVNAYYARTDKINYNSSLKFYRLAPEELTSQNFGFLDCVNFVYNVYYQTLGINVLTSPKSMATYASNYYGDANHKDIVYWYNFQSEPTNPYSFSTKITEKMEVGDIVGYIYEGQVGHVGIVYDISVENGKKVPTIVHASGSSDTVIANKISYRGTVSQPFNYALKKNEAAVKKFTAVRSSFTAGTTNKGKFIWILRPTFSENGKKYYYNSKCSDSNKNIGDNSKNKCTYSNKTEYTVPNRSKARVKYPSIYIGKTVNKVNGSVVKEGDTLTYTINVINKSSTNYGSFSVVEKIPTYVIVTDKVGGTLSENKLTWKISSLKANESTKITYSVKVKTGYYGKEIVSTGTVAGITNSTVKNKIGYNLSTTEQSKISSSYTKLKSKYTGLKLVNEVYKDALGIDLKLDKNFVLGAHYHKYKPANGTTFTSNSSASYKKIDKRCNPYYRDYDSDVNNNVQPIIISVPSSTVDLSKKMSLNPNSSYYDMVLNNYYSGLNFTYVKENDTVKCDKNRTFTSKTFETVYYNGTTNTDYQTTRSRYINVNNLMNGDILIFSNRNDVKNPKENGEYAFIYLDGKFVGNNGSVKIGTINKTRWSSSGYIDNILQQMFTKDFYVILRPSLQIKKVAVSSIKLSKTTAELKVGKTVTLAATASPSNATNKTITWTSSDTSIATVKDGVVTGKKVGKATITAKSNNGKTATATIIVSSKDEPNAATITCLNNTYNGANQTIAKCDGGKIANANKKAVGSYTVTCKGDSTHSDATSKLCSITAADLSKATVSTISNRVYTGSQITPVPTVKVNGLKLVNETDFKISYQKNINVGTAVLTISKASSNYKGTKDVQFKILPVDIVNAKVTIEDQAYTGTSVTPNPKIVFNSKTLTKDVDYTLTYKNNVKAGTATVEIAGKGNFKGKTTRTFKIIIVKYEVKYLGATTVETGLPSTITLKGSEKTPIIKSNKLSLKKNTNYVVSFNYRTTTNNNKFSVDFYGAAKSLSKENITAKTTTKHIDWETSSANAGIKDYYLRFFDNTQESSEKDITISNLIVGTIKAVKIKSGSTLGTLPTPTRKNYNFLGWYTNPTGGTKVTSSTKVTKNMTLYPHWEPISIGVYFGVKGGTLESNTYSSLYDNISKSGNYYKQVINPNENKDLVNYTTFGLTKKGYKIVQGKEWCTSNGICFDQNKAYSYNDYKKAIANNSSYLNLFPNWEMEPITNMSIPSGFTDTGKNYDSSTLKFKTIKENNTKNYYSLIWVKDVYKQMNSFNNDAKGGKRNQLIKGTTNNYKNKGLIAVNGSFTVGSRANIPIIMANGVKTKNTSYKTWLVTSSGEYRSLRYVALGLDKNGKLTYRNVNSKYLLNPKITTGSNREKLSNNGYKDMEDWISQNGIRNTWAITNFITSGWKNEKSSVDWRTLLCQIDEHNFILNQGQYNIINQAKVLHDTFGCTIVVNLDGGGSSALYYKTNTMSNASTIHMVDKGDNRTIADLLYFAEQ